MIEVMCDASVNYRRVLNNRPIRSKRSAIEIQNDVVLLNLQAQVITAR